MLIDKLNLNHLRVFESVYRNKSMTIAAQELHLTQSGVSQHIRHLEDALELKLFDRIKHRLVPTTHAQELFQNCSHVFISLEKALLQLTGRPEKLSGVVRIGMPIEFGNNVLVPLLAKFLERHDDVQVHLVYDFALPISQKLLTGELDFAFVDDFSLDPMIQTEVVYHEVLELCIQEQLLKKAKIKPDQMELSDYESLDIIAYQKGEPIVRKWMAHHFGRRDFNLRVKAQVMDVQGVARFIKLGVGAGVLPRHLITRVSPSSHYGEIVVLPGSSTPLINSISIAYLSGKTQSPLAFELISWLKAELVMLD